MYIKYAYYITKTHIVTENKIQEENKGLPIKDLFLQYIGWFNQWRTEFYPREQEIELIKIF